MALNQKMQWLLDQREMRSTTSVLGFDIIITPDRRVKIVEINGANSGSSGLKKLSGGERDIYGEMFEYIGSFSPKIYTAGKLQNSKLSSFVAELDLNHAFREGVFRQIVPKDRSRFVLPRVPEEQNIEAVIWNHLGDRAIFDEDRFIVINPYAIERATGSKDVMDVLFNGDFGLRPLTHSILVANEEQLVLEQIAESKSDYFVIKPTDGIQGRKVKIFSKQDVLDRGAVELYRSIEDGPYHEPNLILEELIPSQEIYSDKTGNNHFGCMRYLVVVNSDDGDMSIKHFGGYWRLSPKSIASGDLAGRLIANYSNGAIPEFVSEEDLALVSGVVDEFLPVLYKRLLRLPLNERPDDLKLIDYCY
ncbi:hypothetical protein HOD38_00350 [archaeon]|jgi:hypothetical protein|nr:hypothetical protein [archaeon]MBT4396697.1 hypothetical protein [archaeon]MBT4441307.1 hypothetical protein [archaeon]